MELVEDFLGKVSVTVEKDYHSSTKEYDKLVIVEEQGAFKTYISRKPVPVGKVLTDREYWIPFSGVLESIVLDYIKFQQDIMSGLKLKDGAIKERHLASHSVTLDKIADFAVDTYALKDKSVTEDKLSEELIMIIKAATGVDTDLVNTIDKLMKKVFPVEISCNFTPTNLQEKGTTCTVIINNFKAVVDAKETTITRKTVNGVLVETSEYTEQVDNTKSYNIIIDAEGRSANITKTITFVYPIFTGFALDNPSPQNLIKQGLRTSLGTLIVTHTNDNDTKHFYIFSPYQVHKVTTSGINIFDDFEHSIVDIIGTAYHVYRLKKASSTDTFTFEIS